MFEDIPMSIKMTHKTFPEIKDLHAGNRIDESGILDILSYIDHRYDCADFRLICILRSLYQYQTLISKETLNQMKKTVLGFKYHMADPGFDGMCFWSENHQLIFSACEYLAGSLYPNEVFTNTKALGSFHKDRGYQHLMYWFKTRFELGFVEFHSNTYYEEDVAPLSLLIEFGRDVEIQKQATILMDLLMLDFALLHHKGYFSAASGRCYDKQKMDPNQQDVLDIIQKAFDLGPVQTYDYTRLSADFILNSVYQVPQVIKGIVRDHSTKIIQDSNGLYLSEVTNYFKQKKDYYTTGLYLWSMEAFTNHESIELTIDMFHDWQLKHNTFLKDLKTFDNVIFKKLHLLKPLIGLLNPTTQGVAIERANVYTYKHKDFMLSTAQMYVPKTFGDQHHVGGAILDQNTSVFITHPAKAFFKDNSRNFSPSYWVGNGIMPFAYQHENTALYVFDLTPRSGLFEKKRALFTHAYFPEAQFDEVITQSNYIIGVKGKAMIGVQGLNPIERYDAFELRQMGKYTAWAMTVVYLDDVSLEDFNLRLSRSALIKDKHRYAYQNIEIDTKSCTAFYQKQMVNTEYPRLVSPYGTIERNPSTIQVHYENQTLTLNIKELIRDESIS
ncbi:hypothetical protein N7548_07795 [Acholeplasma manati]|uniref:Heparin-sulfate lyase N-terminal domain-containing protein n=1 Tax=Paracholeplasma manati TaxID=591373 RepID=A0ABT2Y7J5_9MOLU|nr:hypothetical protein [Paracholeplasma manati]MCV2232719.1 hypothetical protein [Paracholeplasma manati]